MTAASVWVLLRSARQGDDPTAAIDLLLEHGYTLDRARRACGLRVICPFCESEIDLEVCHCGSLINAHSIYDGHSPVPMGCVCHQLDDATYHAAALRVYGIDTAKLHAEHTDQTTTSAPSGVVTEQPAHIKGLHESLAFAQIVARVMPINEELDQRAANDLRKYYSGHPSRKLSKK